MPVQPPSPGLYRVVQDLEGERRTSLLVAGGYDPREADLTPRPVELPSAEGAAAPPSRGSLPFWPWLAAAVLLVSLVEWWVDARGR